MQTKYEIYVLQNYSTYLYLHVVSIYIASELPKLTLYTM